MNNIEEQLILPDSSIEGRTFDNAARWLMQELFVHLDHIEHGIAYMHDEGGKWHAPITEINESASQILQRIKVGEFMDDNEIYNAWFALMPNSDETE